jgi:glycerol-3-phosphate dehydrogenase
MALAERAGQLGIDAECCKWLIRRHGKRAEEIICDVANDGALAERIVPTLPFIYADLLYCAREEMVEHLDDLLRRRMPLLILAKLDKTELRALADAVSGILAWDTDRVAQELSRATVRTGNQTGEEGP